MQAHSTRSKVLNGIAFQSYDSRSRASTYCMSRYDLKVGADRAPDEDRGAYRVSTRFHAVNSHPNAHC